VKTRDNVRLPASAGLPVRYATVPGATEVTR